MADHRPPNQSYASDVTGANISTVMPESSPDFMDSNLSSLLLSFDAGYALDLSPQRDMASGLNLTEMGEIGDKLAFASNAG